MWTNVGRLRTFNTDCWLFCSGPKLGWDRKKEALKKSTSVVDKVVSFRRIFTCHGRNGAGLTLDWALVARPLFELVLQLSVHEAAFPPPEKRWSRAVSAQAQASRARGKAAVSCLWLLLAFAAVLATLDYNCFAVTSRRPTRVGRSPRSPRGPRSPPSDTRIAQKNLTRQLADVPSAQQLLNILEQELDGELLDHIHISAAFTRFARHKRGFDTAMQQSPVIERLVAKVLSLLERGDLPARPSVNVLWAIASLGERGGCLQELIPPLTQNLAIQSQSMNPQHVANAIWAAATLQLPDKLLRSLLPKLACRVLEKTSEFNAQAVANTMWATATLKGRAPELLEIHDVLAEMAAARAADLTPLQPT